MASESPDTSVRCENSISPTSDAHCNHRIPRIFTDRAYEFISGLTQKFLGHDEIPFVFPRGATYIRQQSSRDHPPRYRNSYREWWWVRSARDIYSPPRPYVGNTGWGPDHGLHVQESQLELQAVIICSRLMAAIVESAAPLPWEEAVNEPAGRNHIRQVWLPKYRGGYYQILNLAILLQVLST